jgi:hypothetical protein
MVSKPQKTEVRPEDNPLAPKRRAARRNRLIDVMVQGQGDGPRYKARTLDLSREGMFLQIVDPSFLPPQEARGIVAFAARARDAFPHGLTAFFEKQKVRVRADVVRVAQHPSKPDEIFGLGCRFALALSDTQCASLGISSDRESPVSTAIPLAEPGAPPSRPTARPAPVAETPTTATPAPPPAATPAPPPPPRRAPQVPAEPAVPSGPLFRRGELELPPPRQVGAPKPPSRRAPEPAVASRPAEDDANPLVAKREDARVERRFSVLLDGARGRFEGRTVDLSPGGALVEIVDPDFLQADARTLVGFARRVDEEFSSSLAVEFAGGSLITRASVVRVVAAGEGVAGLRVGIRFDPPLSAEHCASLGIGRAAAPAGKDRVLAAIEEASEAGSREPETVAQAPTRAPAKAPAKAEAAPKKRAPAKQAVPADDAAGEASFADLLSSIAKKRSAPRAKPPAVSAPKGAVLVHLFPRNGALNGPRYVGVLQSVRAKAVQVDMDLPDGETDAVGYAAGAGGDVRAVFLRDGRVLWDVNARTLFVTDPGDPPRARLTLVPAKPPPKSLVKRPAKPAKKAS